MRFIPLLLLCAGCVSQPAQSPPAVVPLRTTAEYIPIPTFGIAWDVQQQPTGSFYEAFEVDMSTNLIDWKSISDVTNDEGLPWMTYQAPAFYPIEFFRVGGFNP